MLSPHKLQILILSILFYFDIDNIYIKFLLIFPSLVWHLGCVIICQVIICQAMDVIKENVTKNFASKQGLLKTNLGRLYPQFTQLSIHWCSICTIMRNEGSWRHRSPDRRAHATLSRAHQFHSSYFDFASVPVRRFELLVVEARVACFCPPRGEPGKI